MLADFNLGSNLPEAFYVAQSTDFPDDVDLLITAGTSLTVGPANMLVCNVSPSTPRLLVNKEPAGQLLGMRFGPGSKRDVHFAGECDEGFLQLTMKLGLFIQPFYDSNSLGWFSDLLKYREHMCENSQKLIDETAKSLAL